MNTIRQNWLCVAFQTRVGKATQLLPRAHSLSLSLSVLLCMHIWNPEPTCKKFSYSEATMWRKNMDIKMFGALAITAFSCLRLVQASGMWMRILQRIPAFKLPQLLPSETEMSCPCWALKLQIYEQNKCCCFK